MYSPEACLPGVKLLVRRCLNGTHVGIRVFPSSFDVAMGLTLHGSSSVDRRSRTDPGSRAKKPPTPSQLYLRACASRLVVHLCCCCCTAAAESISKQPVSRRHIEARPSASGARRRSYTRGSEVGDRCIGQQYSRVWGVKNRDLERI